MSAKTNATKLSFSVETSLGTLAGSPTWTEAGWTGIGSIGSTVSKTEIKPINQNAMNEKPIITDLDSTLEYSNDLTISGFLNHAQGFFRSDIQEQTQAEPTAVVASDDSFTHVGLGVTIAENSLIFARNYTPADNNGLHVVTTGGSTASTLTTSVLVDEASPPTNSRIDVVGFQGTAGDIQLDSENNLTATTLDFTTDMSVEVGSWIYIGGGTSATTFAGATYTGLCRVRVVEAKKLTLDKRPWTVGAADTGATKTIQLFTGNFIRNVPRDDGDYNAESYTFEAEYYGLEDSSATIYKYPEGARGNEMSLNFPLSDKAAISWSFITTDTPNPTTAQATGTRYTLYDNEGFGTSSDCTQLRIKDSSLVDYTTTFKSLDLTVGNTVSAEKVLCSLGAAEMNDGNFMVSGSASVLMTDENMISAVRNNETLSLDYAIANGDGALAFDIPSLTFDAANDELPEDASIIINFDIKAFRDSFFDFVMSCTHFSYLPV